MQWPERFYDLKRGRGCPFCAEGRPDETPHGIRFFAGELADGYLYRRAVQRGLSHVYYRGRHVVEPTELGEDEARRFFAELLMVGRDRAGVRAARPEWPFPFSSEDPPPFPDAELRADAERLRAAVAR